MFYQTFVWHLFFGFSVQYSHESHRAIFPPPSQFSFFGTHAVVFTHHHIEKGTQNVYSSRVERTSATKEIAFYFISHPQNTIHISYWSWPNSCVIPMLDIVRLLYQLWYRNQIHVRCNTISGHPQRMHSCSTKWNMNAWKLIRHAITNLHTYILAITPDSYFQSLWMCVSAWIAIEKHLDKLAHLKSWQLDR